MKLCKMSSLTGFLFLIGSIWAIPKGVTQTPYKEAKQMAYAMLTELLDQPRMPAGISVAVGRNNEIIYAEGIGFSNLETGKRISPQTQFRAASVSKMMTVTALAKLLESNQLDLDAHIQTYVPSFPQKAYPITARQLSGHLSGIPHYTNVDKIENRFYQSVTEALNVFSHHLLLHEPGTSYRYSTHGYTLLSAVLEGASGKPFLQLLNQSVLEPLKMSATGPDLRSSPSPNMTELYRWDEEGFLIQAKKIGHIEDPSYKWGAGGMVSTPSNLVKMGNGYLYGFIEKGIKEEMFTSQKTDSQKMTGVGIGWRQGYDAAGRLVYEHAGGMPGARSVITIFPENNLTIALMANAGSPPRVEETAHVIASLFLTDFSVSVPIVGSAKGKLRHKAPDGKDVTEDAVLILNGDSDRLVVYSKTNEPTIYPLFYLHSTNTYALVHPYGLLFAILEQKDSEIGLSVLNYRSPRFTPPAQDDPFLSFSGIFEGK